MPDDPKVLAAWPHLKLPPVLDICAAGELKRELQSALAAGPSINVDASSVQRVSTPCLQVLLAAAKSASDGGGRLRLHSVPQALSEAVHTLALTGAFWIGEG